MDTPSIPLKQCSRKDECVNPLGSWLPATLEYFYRNGDKRLSSQCRDCSRAGASNWRAANPDKHRAAVTDWHQKHKDYEAEYRRDYNKQHTEERKAYSKQYRAEHREQILAQEREYYRQNRTKCLEAEKRYVANNPEKVRERRQKHRANNQDKIHAYYEDNKVAIRKRQKINDRKWRMTHPEAVHAKNSRRQALLRNADGTHTASDVRLQLKAQTDKKGRLHCWWCGKVIKADYHVDHRIPLIRGGSNAPENLCIAHPTCNLSKQDKTPAEYMGRLL